MNLAPLLNASFAVQIHVATILPAFFLGTWLIFFSRKGARVHRRLGYAYLVLMTVTSIAALFIHEVDPGGPFGFSAIHLFVPLTLAGVVSALRAARAHDVRSHRYAMIGTYAGAILIAGAFTFVPGRIMHAVFFN